MISAQTISYSEEKIFYVSAGQIIIKQNEGVLYSTPLGSCIAVVSYDTKSKTGGMAHIMLPGKSPRVGKYANKYAFNGINTLIKKLTAAGAKTDSLQTCLIGGANVLKKENDIIAKQLTDSVLKIIAETKLIITASSLGGYERRTAKLHLNSGIVTFTVGNGFEKVLYKFL